MSQADYITDGADYCEYYNEDCDGDCENCDIKFECDDSTCRKD